MNLAIIGLGNMGSAILSGAIRAGILKADDVAVAEPDEAKRAAAETMGAAALGSASEIGPWLSGRGGGQVLLAVKPQYLAAASAELLAGGVPENTVVISILAGTPSEKVCTALGGSVRIVRAMPNLPASIGQGATSLCLGAGALPGDDAFASQLFLAVGPLVTSIPEHLMDSFTAVAGSGPAYLFYLAEAMERAAIAQGFEPEQAGRIVRQTLLGASMLYSGSAEPPVSLRAAVTSKGGTTAAAVGVLESAGAMDIWMKAMEAARHRGEELAGA